MASKQANESVEDYTKWTDENIKARNNFFSSLKVDKIGDELKSLSALRLAKQKSKKPVKPVEYRKSSRLQQKPGVPLNEKILAAAYKNLSSEKRPGQIFEQTLDLDGCRREGHTSAEDIAVCKNVMTHLGSAGKSSDSMRNVYASDVVVSKVFKGKGRVLSLAIHRSTSPLFYAAGDETGGIGLCCSTLSNRCEFEPHDKKPVSGLLFDDCHLLSSCYDGTVRSLDLNRIDAKFELLYSAEDDFGLTSIDTSKDGCNISGNVWVSRADGSVVRIDNRIPVRNHAVHNVHAKFCNSVSTSMKKHLVCTASRDGSACLWDTRAMPSQRPYGRKKKPLALIEHGNSVFSAFFHPTDPFLVLSTSKDGTVRLSRLDGGDFQTLVSLRFDIYDTSKVSPFRAMWHPAGGNFVIGSVLEPRCVKLYSASDASFRKWQCNILLHENIATILSLNVFHPTLPLLIGVNCTGRCHEIYLKAFET